jgi:hypothetical protein
VNSAEKPKLGWGGKRDNQHGRPKLPSKDRRVNFNTKITQETKEWLMKQNEPAGRVIDRLVALAKSNEI